MQARKFKLFEISLSTFDEGGAPSGGGEGSGSASGVANPNGQPKQGQQVVYGKQETEEPAGSTGDNPATHKDPSAEFENLIKGEYKEHFDKRVQGIINQRFKDSKAMETTLSEQGRVIELLMEKHGAKDIQTLYNTLESEVIEELAYKEGMTPEKYREFRQYKQEALKGKQPAMTEEQMNERVSDWYKQADALKTQYPDFDFRSTVADNPEFVGMLNAGVSVKAAFEVLNLDNIKTNVATQATDNAVKNVQSNKSRPRENAGSGNSGVIVKSDPSQFTKADRAEIIKRVQKGERIQL